MQKMLECFLDRRINFRKDDRSEERGEVFSSKNRGDVSGDTFSGGKNTFGDTRIGGVGYFRFKHPVRADHPFFGGGDPEIEDSFQVGLLKVREDSAAVGGLVLGVEVYALIGGVDVVV